MTDDLWTEDPLWPEYALVVACLACNREPGQRLCVLCSQIEDAERATGTGSTKATVIVR